MVTQGVERVYCDMNTRNCGNTAGGWMRAANIDMTDVNNTCPQGLIESIHSSKRMCTRSKAHTGCSSITFHPSHNLLIHSYRRSLDVGFIGEVTH